MIIAVSWLITAIILTFFLYPQLGARGRIWMSIHHLICGIGVIYEFRAHYLRTRAK